MTEVLFKPGYEGDRLSSTLTVPERLVLRSRKSELVQRLHDAMLTVSVMQGPARLGIGAGAAPAHIVEFADRVGEKPVDPSPLRFRPTAAQVSDMDPALKLLEGLRPAYFKVVMFRALHQFSKACGETGSWPWQAIGGYFGLSDRWAEAAYDAAIVQAARRSGILPTIPEDYSVLAAAAWVDRGWMTHLSTAADPRQATANLRGKSPVRLETAFAIWVAGQPLAKRVADEVRRSLRNLTSHGSWYKAHPDVVCEHLIEVARQVDTGWIMEEIALRGALAA